MKTVFGMAILLLMLTAALASAEKMAGLSAEMWQRVHSVEPPRIDLEPTPSPQAPETLSLADCFSFALRHNAGFRQNLQRLENARRNMWVADQRLYYSLSGSGERGRSPGETSETSLSAEAATRLEVLGGGSFEASVGSGTQEALSELFAQEPAVSLSYDQPLLRGAGLASSTYERIRSARTALAAQELSFYDGHQDLAQRIIERYFDVLLARGEVEIAERSADRAKRLYDINYAKFSGEGLVEPGEEWISQVAEIDVDQARLSWERAKQQVISRRQAYRDAMDRLLLDMGFLPGATPELTTAIQYLPQEYDETRQVEIALQNSTELGRLHLEWQDTLAARRIARRERLPDITATAGTTDLGGSTGDPGIGTGWFAGLQIDIPLGDRRRLESADRAERNLQVLQQEIIATRDQVAQEMQRLVRAADSSRARIDIGEQSVALARKSRQAAQGMYDEGLSDYLRVLDADDRLVEAERSLLQDQVQYFLTTIRVRRARGEDITQGLPQ